MVVAIVEAGEVRYCTICRAVYHSELARSPNDGGALAPSSIDPLLGTTVAHCAIDAYLGGGAMGRAYRCHHTHLQRQQFALKVLRGDGFRRYGRRAARPRDVVTSPPRSKSIVFEHDDFSDLPDELAAHLGIAGSF